MVPWVLLKKIKFDHDPILHDIKRSEGQIYDTEQFICF